MESNVYGYIRVSTREQNIERQMISLQEAGVSEKIFILTNRVAKIFSVRLIKK